jgi:hypothetical protein
MPGQSALGGRRLMWSMVVSIAMVVTIALTFAALFVVLRLATPAYARVDPGQGARRTFEAADEDEARSATFALRRLHPCTARGGPVPRRGKPNVRF